MPSTRYLPRGASTPGAPHRRPHRRRLLVVLVALTVLAIGLDLARPDLTEPARRAVATAVGPVQRALTPGDPERIEELTRQRDELQAQVDADQETLSRARDLTALLQSPADWAQQLVPARVVGFSSRSTPVASRTVTLDVGSRDGIRPDLTVLSADGLVGRVARVAPWTADVLVIGGPDVTVGVRFGEAGALGSVSAEHPPRLPGRQPGQLTLTAWGDSDIRPGDEVTTLGSRGSTPYVPGVPVGTVTSVDPGRGQLGRTAVVTPHVDRDTLATVAVVLTEARDTPRGPARAVDGTGSTSGAGDQP